MYYITFNDIPSGIYQSQVIDVVNYLSQLRKKEVRLIAFIPYSDYKNNKNKIKQQIPSAKVLPIWAGITRWKQVRPLLKLFTKRNSVAICRGPIATELALGSFRKVVYDGRAAVKAEVEEFDVTGNKQLDLDFISAEKLAVLKSDYRISVSSKLVDYWVREFGYKENTHVIIPCTLTSQIVNKLPEKEEKDTIRLVYSGGIGPWQSFDLVVKLVREALQLNENISVLFLTKENKLIDNLVSEFPLRCERKWLKHDEVFQALSDCDYGILIRSQNVTNQVASPVKFAEYLNAGLKVLISENLGDFSDFVVKNKCGNVVKKNFGELSSVSFVESNRIKELVNKYFNKNSEPITSMYLMLLNEIEAIRK